MTTSENPVSPRWSTTAKIVVGLFGAAIIAALIFRFRSYIAPLLLAFLLAYLFHPAASFLHKKLKLPWRLASTILFLFLFLCIIGLATWGGISIVEQVQNLIAYLTDLWGDLPGLIANFTSKPLVIGPFSFDISRFDTSTLWTQVQGIVQPILSNLGTLIGSIASGIGSTVTWIVFILLIAYFIMSESNGVRESLINFSLPNYKEDFIRLGRQLSQIWNAFLRGQLIVFCITVFFYSILLGALGMRYFVLLAFIAGLARFVPYIGPFIAWTTYGLVALFQTNYFHMAPLFYALLVVGCALLSDMMMDNFVSPRIMSNALKVHPAAVLVMVFISGALFGFIGILLAAPLLASLKIISTYIFRKLMDMDPWEGYTTVQPPEPFAVTKERWRSNLQKIFKKRAKVNLSEKEDSIPTESTKN